MSRNKFGRTTRRLVLRPFDIKDYVAWKEAHLKMKKPQNKWDLGPKDKKDLTLAKFKKIVNEQKSRRKKDFYYDLGVFKKSGELIGGVAIMEVARGISQTAFLGYRIYNPFWGQGFAKEAVIAMLNIGFVNLKLHRIEAGIEPGNKRSIALAKSLGMRYEGLKKRSLYLRNNWIDLLMYTLTCEDIGLKFRGKMPKFKPRS